LCLGLTATGCDDDPAPTVGADASDSLTPSSDANIPGPDANIPAPDANIPGPDANIPAPDTNIPEPDANIPEPDANIPEPDANIPEPDANIPAPDAEPPISDVTENGDANALSPCEACLASGGTWQPEANACTSNCDIQDISCYTETCPEPCSSSSCSSCIGQEACEDAGCTWNQSGPAMWCN
jgi:hypothetical protein